MGAKKPSVRTNDRGEKMVHYPDGRLVLVPTTTMVDRINAEQEAHKQADAELLAKRLQVVADKRARQAADPAVPSDKTPC